MSVEESMHIKTECGDYIFDKDLGILRVRERESPDTEFHIRGPRHLEEVLYERVVALEDALRKISSGAVHRQDPQWCEDVASEALVGTGEGKDERRKYRIEAHPLPGYYGHYDPRLIGENAA